MYTIGVLNQGNNYVFIVKKGRKLPQICINWGTFREREREREKERERKKERKRGRERERKIERKREREIV